jgi:hypothetical protein
MCLVGMVIRVAPARPPRRRAHRDPAKQRLEKFLKTAVTGAVYVRKRVDRNAMVSTVASDGMVTNP